MRVEVVRDTVGRHDTYMMACAAKYYDDLGYPGHANCTDSRGIAHRMTKDAEPKLTRESGFHPRTSLLTRNFVDYRGICDVTTLGKIDIQGADAAKFLDCVYTNSWTTLPGRTRALWADAARGRLRDG